MILVTGRIGNKLNEDAEDKTVAGESSDVSCQGTSGSSTVWAASLPGPDIVISYVARIATLIRILIHMKQSNVYE